MNFRQVRKKIKTVSNVKQITKAMQMVSSVKMRRAQTEAIEGRSYREILDVVLKRIVKSGDALSTPYITQSDTIPGNKKLYIVISSNKGLCGGFNFNLFKLALSSIDFEKSKFILVGKKGAEFVARTRGEVIADFSNLQPQVDAVSAIFSVVAEEFLSATSSQVFLVYNSFVSLLQQQPLIVQLLPIENLASIAFETQSQDKQEGVSYLIEPSFEKVLLSLIEDYLKDKIRGAILESLAAEHSARMIAMKNATDNATEVTYSLTLLRNKLRQTSITSELLESETAKASTEVM